MMAMAWLRQLDQRARLLLPFLTALTAVVVDVVPLQAPGLESVSPFTTLCVVYFWSLYRPDLFPSGAAFVIGLVHDALAGLPLGATSLLLVLVRSLMVAQQRFFLGRSFLVIWACFLVLVPGVLALRWLLVSLWWSHLFALAPLMVELAATAALYPAVGWLLGRVHNRIPRLVHAS